VALLLEKIKPSLSNILQSSRGFDVFPANSHSNHAPSILSIAKELKLKGIISIVIKKTCLITIEINIYLTLLILQN
jgi:hypothetical protein